MKKVIMAAIVLLTLCSLAAASSIKHPQSFTLNTSTYTAVVNSGASCNGFYIWVADCTGFYYASDAAGSDEVYVDPDVGCGFGFPNRAGKGDTVIWVKAAVGTPELNFQPAQ